MYPELLPRFWGWCAVDRCAEAVQRRDEVRHRGKVEAFGGHDGWYASEYYVIVVVDVGRREKICAILKFSSQETIDSSIDLCRNFLAVK